MKPAIYLKIMSIIQTMVFIVLIMFGLLVMVFGKTIIAIIREHYGGLSHNDLIYKIIIHIILILIVFVIFLFIYKYMSKHKITLKSQIRGAGFASIALNIVSYVFSKYLEIFKGFSITYGSLTTLMLIMMWTYTCFYVIFLGAEVNKLYNKKEKEEYASQK